MAGVAVLPARVVTRTSVPLIPTQLQTTTWPLRTMMTIMIPLLPMRRLCQTRGDLRVISRQIFASRNESSPNPFRLLSTLARAVRRSSFSNVSSKGMTPTSSEPTASESTRTGTWGTSHWISGVTMQQTKVIWGRRWRSTTWRVETSARKPSKYASVTGITVTTSHTATSKNGAGIPTSMLGQSFLTSQFRHLWPDSFLHSVFCNHSWMML